MLWFTEVMSCCLCCCLQFRTQPLCLCVWGRGWWWWYCFAGLRGRRKRRRGCWRNRFVSVPILLTRTQAWLLYMLTRSCSVICACFSKWYTYKVIFLVCFFLQYLIKAPFYVHIYLLFRDIQKKQMKFIPRVLRTAPTVLTSITTTACSWWIRVRNF